MKTGMIIQRVHAIAGILGFLTILTFWISTAWSELFGTQEMIATVKRNILWGMLILVPAMAAVGGSGFRLMRKENDPLISAKKRRMMIIGPNGLFVLLPAAIYLNALASQGMFGTSFYAVQTIELIAGAGNLTLMGLNMRDGLRATGRLN